VTGAESFEADLAAFDEALRESGVPDDDRPELLNRLREVALLPRDDPTRAAKTVALLVDLLPFLDGELRLVRPTMQFEPSGDQEVLEAEVAAFDAHLAGIGALPEERAELAERFRAMAPLSEDDMQWAKLALVGDSMPILERWLRTIGHDEQADVVSRSLYAVVMWLELPDDLRDWAGRPNIG
jgi:hypothetical protein